MNKDSILTFEKHSEIPDRYIGYIGKIPVYTICKGVDSRWYSLYHGGITRATDPKNSKEEVFEELKKRVEVNYGLMINHYTTKK